MSPRNSRSEIGHWEVPTGKKLSKTKATATDREKMLALSIGEGSPPRKITDAIYQLKTFPNCQGKGEDIVFWRQPIYSPQSDLFVGKVIDNTKPYENAPKVIEVRNAASNKKIWTLDKIRENSVSNRTPIAFSTDGKWLAISDGYIVLLDAFSGKIIRTLRSGLPNNLSKDTPWRCIAFSPDNTLLAASIGDYGAYYHIGGNSYLAKNDGTIYVWDLQSGEMLWKNRVPNMAPQSLTFSPDGSVIACASHLFNRPTQTIGGTITLWNVHTGKLEQTLTRETTTDRLALAANIRKQQLLRKPLPMRFVSDNSYPFTALSFSPDSKLLAATNQGPASEIKIWKVQ